MDEIGAISVYLYCLDFNDGFTIYKSANLAGFVDNQRNVKIS
tara:strand:- start:601 stop:726 length:126 start_codon:yes stop_codon:yes gene_type:complete